MKVKQRWVEAEMEEAMKHGKQISVIVYGGGINVRHWADEARKQGFVVVFDFGFARIHERK